MVTGNKIQVFVGLSTDTKPTSFPRLGDRFIESDTGNQFEYRLVDAALEWVSIAVTSETMTTIPMSKVSETDGFYSYEAVTVASDVIDMLNGAIKKLAPIFEDYTVLITPELSEALAVDTGVVEMVNTETRPIITAYIAKSELDAALLFDATDIGVSETITIADGNAVGVDSTFTKNSDPFKGIEGKAGFYDMYKVVITPSSDVTIPEMEINHSIDGGASYQYILKSVPSTPPNIFLGTTVGLTKHYVSGHEYVTGGTSFSQGVNILLAITTHYNKSRIVEVSGDEIETVVSQPAIPPTANATYTPILSLTTKAGVFNLTPSITCKAYGAVDSIMNSAELPLPFMLDDISDEANTRTMAGSGEFPHTGLGGVYDSSVSLIDNEELQLVGGVYKYPSGSDGTTDYSTITGTRYWCSQPVVLDNASGVSITFPNGVNMDKAVVYAMIDGVSDWVSCSDGYEFISDPDNQGEGALVLSESTANYRRVTYGTEPRSGTLYVRVAFDESAGCEFGQNVLIEQY